jgi:hypothetical protein
MFSSIIFILLTALRPALIHIILILAARTAKIGIGPVAKKYLLVVVDYISGRL